MVAKYVDRLRKIRALVALSGQKTVRIGEDQYRARGFYINQLTLHDRHESWLDSVYRAALRAKDGTFIDVGANSGQTLVKILSFDKSRQYLGFEPQLDCCFFIEQFIRQNDLRSHVILPVGLSNKTGVIDLLKRTNEADSTASTTQGFRPDDFYSFTQSIFVAKGDDVLAAIKPDRISTVKIDVEGGELEVIEGLQQTLRENAPFVFFEVLNHFLVVTGQAIDPETVEFREARIRLMEGMLRDIGYAIFNIRPEDRMKEISKIQPEVSADLRITDYVAVHEDHRHAFLDEYEGTLLP